MFDDASAIEDLVTLNRECQAGDERGSKGSPSGIDQVEIREPCQVSLLDEVFPIRSRPVPLMVYRPATATEKLPEGEGRVRAPDRDFFVSLDSIVPLLFK